MILYNWEFWLRKIRCSFHLKFIQEVSQSGQISNSSPKVFFHVTDSCSLYKIMFLIGFWVVDFEFDVYLIFRGRVCPQTGRFLGKVRDVGY
jgi:hypothetical protein